MNTSTRIAKLEGLLSRIKARAALPRTAEAPLTSAEPPAAIGAESASVVSSAPRSAAPSTQTDSFAPEGPEARPTSVPGADVMASSLSPHAVSVPPPPTAPATPFGYVARNASAPPAGESPATVPPSADAEEARSAERTVAREVEDGVDLTAELEATRVDARKAQRTDPAARAAISESPPEIESSWSDLPPPPSAREAASTLSDASATMVAAEPAPASSPRPISAVPAAPPSPMPEGPSDDGGDADELSAADATPVPRHTTPPESGRQVAAPPDAVFDADVTGVRQSGSLRLDTVSPEPVHAGVSSSGDVGTFVGETPRFSPTNFGELLDASLGL
jgi:hypothetical protein